MTALIAAGGILLAVLTLMAAAAREIYRDGIASAEGKQAAANQAAVITAKGVTDDVGKMDDARVYADLSQWMRDAKR